MTSGAKAQIHSGAGNAGPKALLRPEPSVKDGLKSALRSSSVTRELNAVKWAKTVLDLGACGVGAAATIHDLDEYMDNPTATNQAKLVIDDISTVLGCGITGLAAH